MDLVLGFVFVLCLMFLAMIFGEKLSLAGIFDGRWITWCCSLVADLWDQICEDLDRCWCFVVDHVWWVTVATAGGIGLTVTTFLMFSGVYQQAQAARLDDQLVMNVGSVLDHTPVLTEEYTIPVGQPNSRLKVSPVHYVVPPKPEFPARPIDTNNGFPDFNLDPLPDFPGYRTTEPDWPSRSAPELRLSLDSFGRDVVSRSRFVVTPQIRNAIDNAVLSLRWNNDDWDVTRIRTDQDRNVGETSSAILLPESNQFEISDQQSRVRVLPGTIVSTSDLQITKSSPVRGTDGSLELQIRVINTGQDRVDGLLVRELLPLQWHPTNMSPQGTYRSSTVTWLINNLRPFDEQILTLRVISDQPGRFESLTEVSAVAAVSSPVQVRQVEPRRRLPIARPDLRLTLQELPKNIELEKPFTIYFDVQNIGTIDAVGVDLRVTLDEGLGHHSLDDNDQVRRIENGVRRLPVGESRQLPLILRTLKPGLHFATAEMLLEGEQLDLVTFEIRVASPTIEPEDPDFPPLRDFP